MPILTYFFVAGTALMALLFYANAQMEPRGPLAVTSTFEGLPEPWHGPAPAARTLAATPAPAPDMNSEAVLAATPPAEANAKAVTTAAATSGAAPSEQVATADSAPKKKKHVARKTPRPDEQTTPRYAWQSGNPSPFGFFGRF